MDLPTLNKTLATVALSALTAIGLSGPAMADGSRGAKTYQVTITNITPGNVFTPILAATHKNSVAFFKLGEKASDELATLAEGGNTGPLENLLKTLPNDVFATTATGAPLPAGESVQLQISAPRQYRYFSMAAMILPTNDSFVALDTVPLPKRGSYTFYAKGYDAGSEINDELCASIPGPVGCDGNGDGAFTAVDEAFVHISNGIHGIGDLPANLYDWRNPVARVIISRTR